MAPLGWHQIGVVDPQRAYTALLGYVQLRSLAMFPRFTWYGMQIERQLKRTAGLVGYRLQTEFLALKFFHLSAWQSEAAIRSFVHEEPHLAIMQKLVGRLGKTEFRYWSVKGSELPLDFERNIIRA